jgi:hypothetical protein
MKTLKAVKRVRLGDAKKLTKANATVGMSEISNFTYTLSMN